MSERGFTLLEMMVALVILGLGLAALYGRLGDGTGAAATAETERRAAAIAQSMLAELGHSRALADGKSEGDFTGGMHWRLVVSPAQSSQNGPPPLLVGHLVTLTLSWTRAGRREDQSFRTLMIAAPT